jgi:ribosomal protein S18 acetylase RimI-like enzyme
MINYSIFNKSVEKKEVAEILALYDSFFIPKISDRNNLVEFAEKLSKNATFIFAKKQKKIVGFAAFYFNASPKSSYLTLIAVDNRHQGLGIGKAIIEKMIEYCEKNESEGIMLEMRVRNKNLLDFYYSLGFEVKDKFTSTFNGETKLHLYFTCKKKIEKKKT